MPPEEEEEEGWDRVSLDPGQDSTYLDSETEEEEDLVWATAVLAEGTLEVES